MEKMTARKQEIITVASKLFEEKGYSAVSMRDIAREMGMKAASLYNHIKSKQDILTCIIISLAEEFTQGMETIKNLEVNSIQKIKEIVTLHVDISSQNSSGMASLNNDWMHLENELENYLNLRLDYEDSFRNIIKEGINKKEIINANLEVILFSMLSTLRSLYLWIHLQNNLTPQELSANLSKVLLQGINK